jgi:hypothetical protein
MAEFSSLVAIFIDPDSGAPSGLQALVEGDTISSSVLDPGSRQILTRVVDSSSSWEEGLDAATYADIVTTSGRAEDLLVFSGNVETSTAAIEASTLELINVSSVVFDNSGGWDAGIDPAIYDDFRSVSGSVKDNSGTWNSTYAWGSQASSTLIGVSGFWNNTYLWADEASGSIGAASGNWNTIYNDRNNIVETSGRANDNETAIGVLDASVTNVNIWSGTVDASVGVLDASVTNVNIWSGTVDASVGVLDASVTNINIWSGTVDASVIDISGYITANEGTWAAGVEPGFVDDVRSVSGTVLDGSGNWTTIYGDRPNIIEVSSNFSVFSGNVEASTADIAGSAVDLSAYIRNNEGGWAAGIDPGFYNDVRSVSGSVLNGSGGWDTIYNDRPNIVQVSSHFGIFSGDVEVSVGVLDASVTNVNIWSGTVDTSVGVLDASVTDINIWSGTVDASVGVLDASVTSVNIWSGTVDTSVGVLDASVTNVNIWSGTVDASVGVLDASVTNVNIWSGTVDTSVVVLDASVTNVNIWSGTVETSVGILDGDVITLGDGLTDLETSARNLSGILDASTDYPNAYVTTNRDDIDEARTVTSVSSNAFLTGANPRLANALNANGKNIDNVNIIYGDGGLSLSGTNGGAADINIHDNVNFNDKVLIRIDELHTSHSSDPSGGFFIHQINDNTTTLSGNGIINLRNRLNRNDFVGNGTIGDFSMSASNRISIVHDPDATGGVVIGRGGIGTAFETNDFKASADNWSDVYDAWQDGTIGGGGTQIEEPHAQGGVVWASGTGGTAGYGNTAAGTAGTVLFSNGTGSPYFSIIRSSDLKNAVGTPPPVGEIMVGNGSNFTIGDHGSIGGLDDDDHPQYVLSATNLALSGVVDALGAFSYMQMTSDGTAGFSELNIGRGATQTTNEDGSNNIVWDSANNEFDVSATGTYHIIANLVFNAAATASVTIAIKKNTTAQNSFVNTINSAEDPEEVTIQAVVDATAGDTISVIFDEAGSVSVTPKSGSNIMVKRLA